MKAPNRTVLSTGTRRVRLPWSLIALALVVAAGVQAGCFNDHAVTTVSSTRFEVATASVVLGARQLLVDTSNGDVWILEGERAPDAHWVLLTRGPDDAREPVAKRHPKPVEAPEGERS